MEITKVQVFLTPRDPEAKLKAFARICLDDELELTSLRVYEGINGPFVAYPNDPNYKGEDYKQIYYPVSRSLRELISDTILRQYQQELSEMEEENYATAYAETRED